MYLQRIKQRACFHHFTWLCSLGTPGSSFQSFRVTQTTWRRRWTLGGLGEFEELQKQQCLILRWSLPHLCCPSWCPALGMGCRGSTGPAMGWLLWHSRSVSWGAALCLGIARVSSIWASAALSAPQVRTYLLLLNSVVQCRVFPSALGTRRTETSISKNSAYPDKSASKCCLWMEQPFTHTYFHVGLQTLF